jgi:hypothetical protein
MISFTLQPLYPRKISVTHWTGRPQSRSERCGEQKNPGLPEIEPRSPSSWPGYYAVVDILGTNSVWTCGQIKTFTWNILPPSLALNMETITSSETSVTTYKTTRCLYYRRLQCLENLKSRIRTTHRTQAELHFASQLLEK